jgi:hypothetical protein
MKKEDHDNGFKVEKEMKKGLRLTPVNTKP